MHSKYSEHYLHHRAMHDILQFGSKVDPMSYLAWEKRIEKLHPFLIRGSKYCIVDLCTSRFITHASEWWHSRQNLVHIGRKYAIRNWEDLRACIRRQFVPTNFERTQALKRELKELVERGLNFIDNEPQFLRRAAKYKKRRDILLWEKRERAFQKQKEQEEEERENFEKEMRDKEEQKVEKLRKENEEKERKEYEEKERVRQEEELKRKEEELKRKEEEIKRKEAKELLSRAVKIQHPCLNLKIKIPKGVIPSLHSTFSSINYFVLVLSKNVFPPSFIISNSSKDFSKPNFDLDLPFRFQLSQSENHNFCEMGRISHFFKLKSPSAHIFYQYLLHGLYDFIEIMFDDCCRYDFDPGGT